MLSESTLVSLPTAGQLSELGRLDQLVTLALQQEHEEPSNSFTTFDNTDKDSTTSSAPAIQDKTKRISIDFEVDGKCMSK